MKVIWVYENISRSKTFYSKFNILLLLASVSLWKRNHREDTCVLYADNLTIDTLNHLKLLEFWDQIRPLPKSSKINKEVFWSASKLEVLSEVEEPVIIMDHDTHVYKPIKHLLDSDTVYVSNFEIGKGYYPNATNNYLKQLSFKPRWITDSVNVSFLHLPDPVFTRKYANLSIKLMEELTAIKAPHSMYLIFAEQLLLNQLLVEDSIQTKSIISTYWDCKKDTWGEDHSEGFWPYLNSQIYFKHYGPTKSKVLQNKDGLNYESEIIHLKNCIKLPNLDLSSIYKR